MKQHVDMIFFDLDGTLVDSEEGIIRSVQALLTECACAPKTPAQIRSYIGTGVEDLIEKSTGVSDTRVRAEMLVLFHDIFVRMSDRYSRLYECTMAVLDHFKDTKKAIVTNRKKAQAVLTLKHFRIDAYFVDVAGSDDLTCVKPRGCPIQRMLAAHAVSPSRAIMVGDMAVDILAGKDAQTRTCAVMGGIGDAASIAAAQPDYVIAHIGELLNIIT
jgi:phosphoglycolate phosphatase